MVTNTRAPKDWPPDGCKKRGDSKDRHRSVQVLLVGSAGGHLAQLVALEPWWADLERAWVTFDLEDARSILNNEKVFWAFYPTTRNLVNFLRNGWLAWRVLRRQRPDVVITTGAGVAVPFFLLSKMMGTKTVYLEVYDRIDTSPLTTRLCRPFTDLFLVQWREQQRMYPEAHMVGQLL